MESVYAAHTVMEARSPLPRRPASGRRRPAAQAALGVIKLRGRYEHESPTERGERSRVLALCHSAW